VSKNNKAIKFAKFDLYNYTYHKISVYITLIEMRVTFSYMVMKQSSSE